jgi:hypothetical protein
MAQITRVSVANIGFDDGRAFDINPSLSDAELAMAFKDTAPDTGNLMVHRTDGVIDAVQIVQDGFPPVWPTSETESQQ